MESIRFGGRLVAGFGVGAPLPQIAHVQDPHESGALMEAVEGAVRPFSRKLGAFVGGAVASGIASATAVALFGEGINLGTAVARLKRGVPVFTASAIAGGIVGAIIAP